MTTDDALVKRAARPATGIRLIVATRIMVGGSESMTKLEQMNDRQFEQYALRVLERELGLSGLASLNRSGRGDYIQPSAVVGKEN